VDPLMAQSALPRGLRMSSRTVPAARSGQFSAYQRLTSPRIRLVPRKPATLTLSLADPSGGAKASSTYSRSSMLSPVRSATASTSMRLSTRSAPTIWAPRRCPSSGVEALRQVNGVGAGLVGGVPVGVQVHLSESLSESHKGAFGGADHHRGSCACEQDADDRVHVGPPATPPTMTIFTSTPAGGLAIGGPCG